MGARSSTTKNGRWAVTQGGANYPRASALPGFESYSTGTPELTCIVVVPVLRLLARRDQPGSIESCILLEMDQPEVSLPGLRRVRCYST